MVGEAAAVVDEAAAMVGEAAAVVGEDVGFIQKVAIFCLFHTLHKFNAKFKFSHCSIPAFQFHDL